MAPLASVATSAYTWYNATTTRFDVPDFNTQKGSCGGCSLNLFDGEESWAVVSAAESMQAPFACDNAYQCATGADQINVGGVAAGCGECFSVRTQGYNPYGVKTPMVQFYAVVLDTCANEYSPDWCPKEAGGKNQFGNEYHLNVLGGDAEKLGLGDNPVVHFRPIECPAKITTMMQASCCDQWYKGVGCNSICPDNQCDAPKPKPKPDPAPSPSPVPEGECKPVCAEDRACIAQVGGHWSQCVDCSNDVFQEECNYMGDDMKQAAENFCKTTCTGAPSPPPASTCYPGCEDSRTCVAQDDGYWAQCVDCGAKFFQEECKYMGSAMRAAAEAFCDAKCPIVEPVATVV